MKPYPVLPLRRIPLSSSRWISGPQGLGPGDIVGGEIRLGRVNRQIVGAAFDRGPRRTPVVHAQFNACYAFAAALVDGKVDIATFTPQRILAGDVAWAARLHTADADDIVPTAVPPARVSLVLRDGRVLERSRELMKGSPEEPMTQAEVLAKFRSCLGWGMGADAAATARLESAIQALDRLDDVRTLVGAFRGLSPVRAAA